MNRKPIKTAAETKTDLQNFRLKLHEIIFEADTRVGRIFDIILLWAIVTSVAIVMLESVESINQTVGQYLKIAEWVFTVLFSIEYLLRLFSVARPVRFAFSFFGIIDLLSIVPTYMSLFFAGTQFFLVVRILRLLRVFRVLKLARYLGEAMVLRKALVASKPKIVVFLTAVISIVMIIGTMMYLIEGPKTGFTSIPRSIYWAIVTLTTVGYGDIAPGTVAGQTLAAFLMIMGYGIIAVPTGIVTAELTRSEKEAHISTQACRYCGNETHYDDAVYCHSCGKKIEEQSDKN